jgi:spore maturation protein CgeB
MAQNLAGLYMSRQSTGLTIFPPSESQLLSLPKHSRSPLRVVVIGAGRKYKTEAAVARAVRSLGHHCRLVNTVTWTQNLGRFAAPLLSRQVESFEPDVLILGRHAALLGEQRLRQLVRGRYSAFWYFDLRTPPIEDVLTLGRMVDAMFTTYLSQVETYRGLGVPNVLHLPQGVDPEFDRPARWIPSRYRCEVTFIGTGASVQRHSLLLAMARSYDLQIRGPGWRNAPPDLPVVGGPVYGRAYARAVGGAAITLGASSHHAQPSQVASASNRMWKVMGCGGFYLGEWVEGIEAFGQHGVHCAWYRHPEEALQLVQHYLDDPEQRREVAETGRRHALEHHTYAHRVRLLLEGRGYPLAQTIL